MVDLMFDFFLKKLYYIEKLNNLILFILYVLFILRLFDFFLKSNRFCVCDLSCEVIWKVGCRNE